jgi:branched-chain amino acid aminotransferase
MNDKDKLISAYKGTLVPFDLRDRGLLLGDGLFETIAIFNHVPFQLEAHLVRLEQGGHKLKLQIDRDRINEAITTVIAESPMSHAILRITVTRGSGDRGLLLPAVPTPTIIASIAPWTPLNNKPITLVRSSIKRNESSPISQIKSLCYLDQIMALQEAVEAGYDDAVMLNTNNKVACASSANIICLYGNRLVTPPVSDGVLPGIMRDLVLQDAGSLGFEACEASLTWGELLAADTVFLTNSVKLVRHVTSINLHQWTREAGYVAISIRSKLIERIVAECGADPVNLLCF